MLSGIGIAVVAVILILAPMLVWHLVRGRRDRARLDELEERLETVWDTSSARRPIDFLSSPARRSKASVEHRKRRLHRMLEALEQTARARSVSFGEGSIILDDLDRRLRSFEEPGHS